MATARKPRAKLLVAAIDFGTTFSSWAYSFGHEFQTSPTNVHSKNWIGGSNISDKAPTAILIKSDRRSVEAFGYKAEDRYADLCAENQHRGYYYFRRFKMKLNDSINLRRNIMLDDEECKQLPALCVFSLAIKCLKDDLMEECKQKILNANLTDQDVEWVITVPAIWNAAAKQFMREAGVEAGIPTNKLQIALEPEAASLFCKHLAVEKKTGESGITMDTFSPGTKYLVVDAGGGTVDIAVHQVARNGSLKELYRASGGAWGGTKVDEDFRMFLIKLFGAPAMTRFKKKHMDDYLDMFRTFEVKKRDVSLDNDTPCRFTLHANLVDIFKEETGETLQETIQHTHYSDRVSVRPGNKIDISNSLMKEFFQSAIENIQSHLKDLFKIDTVKDTQFMLLVGGFSESKLLKSSIEASCPGRQVVVAPEASLSVLKGAVIFGHDQSGIEERVALRTYGIGTSKRFIEGVHPEETAYYNSRGYKKCDKSFDKLTQIGEHLKVDERRKLPGKIHPQTENPVIRFPLYESLLDNPVITDNESTTHIGTLRVNLSEESMALPREDREFTVSVLFGRTQIEVEATEISTGKTTKETFDALL